MIKTHVQFRYTGRPLTWLDSAVVSNDKERTSGVNQAKE
jgi:hypothetical protein